MFIASILITILSKLLVASAASILNNNSENVLGTVLLANVIFRHGDRTPVDSYPTDPYRSVSNWPEGWGQLTKVGKEQEYELGLWFRHRYKDFLPEGYSNQDIYIRSTDVDRTLMSAECTLAGLYPPTDPQEWHVNLKWQPIPVHTKPENDDEVLAAKKRCDRYKMEYEKMLQSETMRNINKINAQLYEYLSLKSGYPVKDVVALEYLYDILKIEELNNKTLPDWTKSVYPSKMESLAAFSFTLQAKNKELQRLKSGPLLQELISNMKAKQNDCLEPPQKLFMYSAHDTTLANLMMTLNVFEIHCPPYAAAILIELRKKFEDYFVTVSYRNSSSHEPFLLQIPGCDVACPFDSFVSLTQSVIPENWEEECQIDNMVNQFQLNELALLALSLCATLAFLLCISITITVLYCKRQNSSAYNYHSIHTEIQ